MAAAAGLVVAATPTVVIVLTTVQALLVKRLMLPEVHEIGAVVHATFAQVPVKA